MYQRYSGSFSKIHMLEYCTRPTKLEWVGGGAMNLEHLPGKSNMDPGLKLNPLSLWFLNFCVNQDDSERSVKLRFLDPTLRTLDANV